MTTRLVTIALATPLKLTGNRQCHSRKGTTMVITYMTPAHRTLVDSTLVAVHNRAVELIKATNYPIGKNPAQPTIEIARQSPLGRDLEMIVAYVEGHQIDGTEVNAVVDWLKLRTQILG